MKTGLTIILFLISLLNVKAQIAPIDKHKVANGGYDVVAYFADNAALKGNSNLAVEHNGAKYYFTSADHKKSFEANPALYLPQCDGYCAWGVAEKNARVPINPETYKIINGKLYLFFNSDFKGSPLNALSEWNKNEQALLQVLPANWEKLKSK